MHKRYDVAVLGAGLAGLALCRQLLLRDPLKKILLLDNRPDIPGKKQKVGESLVQVAGYYFARVLDLEEHLLQEHYPKFNLRFHWKTPGKKNDALEDYGCSFVGGTSNVGTYQLNRNALEEFMLKSALETGQVEFCAPAVNSKVSLSQNGPHKVQFEWNGDIREARAEWIVDTTGRGQFLKRKQGLNSASPIRHGSSWCWVDGLVNIEKLTRLTASEIRKKRDGNKQGLFPMFLATNHFCGEGFWFWVIPLHGITSLGVVYDNMLFPAEKVSTAEKLIQWACEEFPIFRKDFAARKIVDAARLRDYAYDCSQTISPSKWALSGMSGRFSDPLYSPGSDLIAYYNTMIVDCIMEASQQELEAKCQLYEPLMRVVYDAYVPSYAVSYDTLGDQEVFTLKYSWELAVYFLFYAFPFINDLFTNAQFVRVFFRKFAQLGPINGNLQHFLSAYYQWKKNRKPQRNPFSNDFKELMPLKKAEMSYYRLVDSVPEAEELLDNFLENLKEFDRFILAHISSVIVQDSRAVTNRSFVESIKLRSFVFDPEKIRQMYKEHEDCTEQYAWNLDAMAMEKFHPGIWSGATKARVMKMPATGGGKPGATAAVGSM